MGDFRPVGDEVLRLWLVLIPYRPPLQGLVWSQSSAQLSLWLSKMSITHSHQLTMQVSTSTLRGSAGLLHTWILSNPLLTLFQMFHSRSLLTTEDLPLIVSWHLAPLAPSLPPPTLITDACFFSMCHSGHCTLPLCPPYQESRQAKPETSDYNTLIQSETVSFMFTL